MFLRAIRSKSFQIPRFSSTSAVTNETEVDGVAAHEENIGQKTVDPKDRSRKIDVETSIRYMKSKAFQEAYGGELIWKLYRRNYKGGRVIPKTRKTCIRANRIATGSPCPICRDEYLVVDYTNLELLHQFICPAGGNILPTEVTGLCQKQHMKLTAAITKAQDFGLIKFDVPFRHYDYNLYYKQLK